MKCIKCGKVIRKDALSCRHCGAAQNSRDDGLKSGKTVFLKSAVVIFYITILIIFVLVLIPKSVRTSLFSIMKTPLKLKMGCKVIVPDDKTGYEKLNIIPLVVKGTKLPTDIAVYGAGEKLFIADAKGGYIRIYDRKSENSYSLVKSFVPNGRDTEKSNDNTIYITTDRKNMLLYVLDCATGVISEYDYNGNYKGMIVNEGFLMGARSIEYFETDGGELAAIIPSRNGFIVYDLKGNVRQNVYGDAGTGCSQFNQPAFVSKDKDGIIYVVDAGNNIIKTFSKEMDYIEGYETVTGPTIFGAQLVINKDWETPYIAITMRHVNALRIHSIGSEKSIKMEFGRNGVPELKAPSPMEIDSEGALYIVSPFGNNVVKVVLPEKLF